jgi:hypothetical protein
MDMNIAAAGNTDVVRAKVRTLEMLGLQENIEDILITLDSQYHLIRLLQGQRGGDGLNIARLHLETRAVTARLATLLDIRAFQDPFQGR